MRDNIKRMIGGDLFPPEEQPEPKKPNVIKPFSHSGSSPFQPWKLFCKKSLDVEQENPHITNSITDEVQADKPSGSNCNNQQDMDQKRLKRILSNRASARRSRLKKNVYLADLEKKEKSFQSTIALIQPQIASYENHKQLLLFENHNLKLQMATRERERLLQEVEIEKNKAEVNRLSELYKKLTIEKQARMVNTGVPIQFMPNYNLNPSGSGQFICLNPNQAAQNIAETSRMQGYASQQPQNQSWIRMDNWNNGQKSIPNMNVVKIERED